MDKKWRPLYYIALRAIGLGVGAGIFTGSWQLGLSIAAFDAGTLASFVGSMLEASHDER